MLSRCAVRCQLLFSPACKLLGLPDHCYDNAGGPLAETMLERKAAVEETEGEGEGESE